MKLVAESLEQLHRGNESSLYYYELLNEGIQFSNTKDAIQKASKLLPKLNKNKRLNLLSLLFLMAIGQGQSNTIPKEEVKANPSMVKLADKETLSPNEITYYFKDILNGYKEEKEDTLPLLQMSSELIDTLNGIKPNLYSSKELELYNKYDEHIIKAVRDLQSKGEKPNIDLIKTIMLIETGMKPTKNRLGFEGFPQTKQKYIDWINDKYKTSFSLKDMYDPLESAKFIHYYIKAINKSRFVTDTADVIAAYNWGTTNLGKFKQGNKEMPKETKDYIKMMNIFSKYFT